VSTVRAAIKQKSNRSNETMFQTFLQRTLLGVPAGALMLALD
jgi:hypothetical protein